MHFILLLSRIAPGFRLWTPIDGEFDDYIVNPKPSGYQVCAIFLFSLVLEFLDLSKMLLAGS